MTRYLVNNNTEEGYCKDCQLLQQHLRARGHPVQTLPSYDFAARRRHLPALARRDRHAADNSCSNPRVSSKVIFKTRFHKFSRLFRLYRFWDELVSSSAACTDLKVNLSDLEFQVAYSNHPCLFVKTYGLNRPGSGR